MIRPPYMLRNLSTEARPTPTYPTSWVTALVSFDLARYLNSLQRLNIKSARTIIAIAAPKFSHYFRHGQETVAIRLPNAIHRNGANLDSIHLEPTFKRRPTTTLLWPVTQPRNYSSKATNAAWEQSTLPSSTCSGSPQTVPNGTLHGHLLVFRALLSVRVMLYDICALG
jgi:hypothetical protein